jgi:hypothetical protein
MSTDYSALIERLRAAVHNSAATLMAEAAYAIEELKTELADAFVELGLCKKERDDLCARFTEIAPCDPGDTTMLIAARACAAHRAVCAERDAALAALPDTGWVLHCTGGRYEHEWTSTMEGYTADQMREYAHAAIATVSGADDPVGIPADEQTAPVSAAPTFRLAADHFEWSSLYNAVSHMIAKLVADGSISTDDTTVEAVMNALYRLDAGQFVPGLAPRAALAAAPTLMAEPAAWVDSLDRAQPHCVTDLKYCSLLKWDRGEHLKYIPLYASPQPAPEPLSDELLDRIERALERHVYGHAARRIPADKTDSDVVLYELRTARAVLAAAQGEQE